MVDAWELEDHVAGTLGGLARLAGGRLDGKGSIG